VRQGIAGLVGVQPDMTMVAEAATGREAIQQFRAHRPDVTLMDVQMPEMNGLDALIAIRTEFPNARVVVLTTYEGDVQILRALKAGAQGYLLKNTLHSELLQTIRAVHAGRRNLSPEVSFQVAQHVSDEALTPAEILVLRLISGGNANNPFFYVSSSPWNLFEVLAEFLELRKIPAGPLLLRDWGVSSVDPGEGGHAGHKTRHITTLLELYPALPFILVGDSGQEDPEIYHRAVRDHPERILAVYIRNVSRRPERVEAIRKLAAEVEKSGSTLILADDTLAAARHAAEKGWIDPAALPEIGEVAHAEDRPRAEELKEENKAMSRGQED